jgi:hypothetical protein
MPTLKDVQRPNQGGQAGFKKMTDLPLGGFYEGILVKRWESKKGYKSMCYKMFTTQNEMIIINGITQLNWFLEDPAIIKDGTWIRCTYIGPKTIGTNDDGSPRIVHEVNVQQSDDDAEVIALRALAEQYDKQEAKKPSNAAAADLDALFAGDDELPY